VTGVQTCALPIYSIDGVTHAYRSKEFELRKELIDAILDALKMRKPTQGFFSRLEFKGMPISKRIIKPLIEEGKVTWYDDPRLPTLEALKRRGIKPEAIRKFIMSLGLTKANTLAPFDAPDITHAIGIAIVTVVGEDIISNDKCCEFLNRQRRHYIA
jgi:glutamyl/glutaminyl-tRNA synthetase